MIHLIYGYLILVSFFVGARFDNNEKWYNLFYCFIDCLMFPFWVIYNLLKNIKNGKINTKI